MPSVGRVCAWNLDALQGRLRAFAAERDWQPFHGPKNLVMALSGEVGEVFQRRTSGARSADPDVHALVEALTAASEEFRRLWQLQEVAQHRTSRKVLLHPQVGHLELECDVVVTPPSGQRLVLFRPQPGTGTTERLDVLRVVGVQDLSPASHTPPRTGRRPLSDQPDDAMTNRSSGPHRRAEQVAVSAVLAVDQP